MQDDGVRAARRRVASITAVLLAVVLLSGLAGCGGSSDASDAGSGTTQPSTSGRDDTDPDTPLGRQPNPCDLVSAKQATSILGSDAADGVFSSTRTGTGSKACTWQTQAGKDDPSLDGAGHIVTLNVSAPPESVSMDDFWATSKGAGGTAASVGGCDEAFWLGGLLNARKGDVYLIGTSGLNSQDPDAKAATKELVADACGSL